MICRSQQTRPRARPDDGFKTRLRNHGQCRRATRSPVETPPQYGALARRTQYDAPRTCTRCLVRRAAQGKVGRVPWLRSHCGFARAAGCDVARSPRLDDRAQTGQQHPEKFEAAVADRQPARPGLRFSCIDVERRTECGAIRTSVGDGVHLGFQRRDMGRRGFGRGPGWT